MFESHRMRAICINKTNRMAKCCIFCCCYGRSSYYYGFVCIKLLIENVAGQA